MPIVPSRDEVWRILHALQEADYRACLTTITLEGCGCWKARCVRSYRSRSIGKKALSVLCFQCGNHETRTTKALAAGSG